MQANTCVMQVAAVTWQRSIHQHLAMHSAFTARLLRWSLCSMLCCPIVANKCLVQYAHDNKTTPTLNNITYTQNKYDF